MTVEDAFVQGAAPYILGAAVIGAAAIVVYCELPNINNALQQEKTQVQNFLNQPGSAVANSGTEVATTLSSGDIVYLNAPVVTLTNATNAQIASVLQTATNSNTTTIVRDVNSSGQTISTSSYAAAPVISGPGSIDQPYPVNQGWKGPAYYINTQTNVVTAYETQIGFIAANGPTGLESYLHI